MCGGARARTKGSGLGPDGVGLRGFKSHPPHQTFLSFFILPKTCHKSIIVEK